MLGKAAMMYVLVDYLGKPHRDDRNPDDPGIRQPGLIRRWLKQRADRRALDKAWIRLSLTAPHLLDDVGLADYGLGDTMHAPARRLHQANTAVEAKEETQHMDFGIAAE